MRARSQHSRVIKFGVFEVDLQEAEVRRDGLRQKLGPQPFQVLQALLERPGETVTREELRQRLWPENTLVDYDLALKKCVNRIREVLGDSPESPRFIETIPRRGYRFIAPLQYGGAEESASLSTAIPRDEFPGVGETDSAKPSTHAPRFLFAAVTALVLMVCISVAVYMERRRAFTAGGTPITGIHALAVLPLENLSSDQGSDYYAEGMTDELITQVAKMSDVRVISRTSVMPFEGKRKPLDEIARALNVDAVVEGTVFRSAGRVRITAQLIQVSPEKHLWAESYNREERDVLALQADLAESIARKISASIKPGRQTTPINIEAHENYLRGRYWWHQRGREAEAKGLQYFQRAVEIDPSYAAGWAGIADSYVVMAHHGGLPPNDAMPKAKTAALKALQFDDSLAEAHASLATIKLSYDWDYPAAESEFKRAIELDPNYATAHHWYSHYLVVEGRFDEALNEIQLAHQLDSYSGVINYWWGHIYYYRTDYPHALAQFQSMLELEPALAKGAHDAIANIKEQQGLYAEAIQEYRHADPLTGEGDAVALAKAYALGGAESYWRQRIKMQQAANSPALHLAITYSRAGNRDATLAVLERDCQQHSPWLNFMAREPAFEWLRTDPRFKKIAVQVGLK